MSMGETLNVAVMGVGRMGQHHARVYSQLAGCKLVAVVDANPENAKKVSELYGCRAFATVHELLAANLRKHFRRQVATTPTAYRRAFSG